MIHYINTESGHSKTSNRCEWNEPKISKAGKEKYCKGKKIEELFPPKPTHLKPCIPINTVPNFITPSLFKIVYDEEKKTECERIVSEVLNNLIENVLKSLNVEQYYFLINRILINQKQEKNIFKPDFVNKITETFYENNVKLSKNKIMNICIQTIQQSNTQAWFDERSIRLSASKAHLVKIRLRNFEKLAITLINEKPMFGRGLKNVTYGNKNEKIALKKYIEMYEVEVYECGLVINHLNPWLCGSPDGIVMSDGKPIKVLEIKCPISCQNQPIITDAGECNLKYLIKDSNGVITLKKNHIYYTQCQVLMYCCGLQYCDIFIYSSKYKCILININRDDNFLKKCISKMNNFYFKYYLKQLIVHFGL